MLIIFGYNIRSISESQGEISRLGSLLSESLESQKTVEQSNKDQAEQLAEEEEKVLSLTSDLEQLQKEFVEERKSVKKLRAEKDKLRKQLDDKIEKVKFVLKMSICNYDIPYNYSCSNCLVLYPFYCFLLKFNS